MELLYLMLDNPCVRYGVLFLLLFMALKPWIGPLLLRIYRSRSAPHPKDWKNEVVYLYGFYRAMQKDVVNLSPFAVKVESWLRLHKIPYEFIETDRFSKATGQVPFIFFNGEEYTDSNMIIELLGKHYDVDMTEGLSPEQNAVTLAFTRMLDEHTSWTYRLQRYSFQPHLYAKVFRWSESWIENAFMKRAISKGVFRACIGHGMGRKPPRVVGELGMTDLRAVSAYLGEKQFMMGDNITLLDCTVFGHLSQIVYVDFPFEEKKVFETGCANIKPYMERVKSKLWPDWDSLAPKGTFDW